MAVRIRLRRIGAKKKPFYRVVVADSRSPRDGRFLDTIGWYDPLADPARIQIDEEKAQRWLAEGAEPSDSARSVLSMAGVLGRRAGGDVPAPAQAAAPKAAAPKAVVPAPAEPAAASVEPPAVSVERAAAASVEPAGESAEPAGDSAETAGDSAEPAGEPGETAAPKTEGGEA